MLAKSLLLDPGRGPTPYNKMSEKKIKKKLLYLIASERIKKLEINLIKKMKDMYTENYKILIQSIEENTNKWKDILCLWVRRTNIANSIPPKVINTFNAIPVNILMVLFKKLKKKKRILKFV